MAELGSLVDKVRSKNAGPFWATVDIFCGTAEAYEKISTGLSTEQVARRLETAPERVKRFDIPALRVVKFSFPRPAVQGALADRDMHGAGWAATLSELEID